MRKLKSSQTFEREYLVQVWFHQKKVNFEIHVLIIVCQFDLTSRYTSSKLLQKMF